VAAGILSVFLYSHYVTDEVVFPLSMTDDMHLGQEVGVEPESGLLSFVAVTQGSPFDRHPHDGRITKDVRGGRPPPRSGLF
jgi:hypothetical protein